MKSISTQESSTGVLEWPLDTIHISQLKIKQISSNTQRLHITFLGWKLHKSRPCETHFRVYAIISCRSQVSFHKFWTVCYGWNIPAQILQPICTAEDIPARIPQQCSSAETYLHITSRGFSAMSQMTFISRHWRNRDMFGVRERRRQNRSCTYWTSPFTNQTFQRQHPIVY